MSLFPFLEQSRDLAPTFAEPGEGRSFTASLIDGFRGGDPVKTDVGTMFGFDPGDTPQDSPWLKTLRAAYRSQVVVDNTYAREEALEEAADRRIKAIEAATGERLRNFTRVPPTISTMAGLEPEQPQGETPRDEFHRRLTEIQQKHPELADVIRAGVPIEEDAREIARQAEGALKEALSDPNLSTGGALFGSLAGGVAGSFRDPLQVSTLFAGGGAGTAATAAGRIAQVAAREALINAGAVALTQPQVQAWRAEAGVRSGIVPALENVGMAALFGAIIGGPIQGLREIKGPARDAVQRVLDGAGSPEDVATAARALDMPPEARAAVDAAVQAVEADRAALGKAPDGISPDQHDDLVAAAVRHAENPVENPPPAALVAEAVQDPAIAARVAEAQPRTQAEARAIAADAMEEIGTKNTVSRAQADLDAPLARVDARGEPIPPPDPAAEPVKLPKGDPLDRVPWVREDGTATMLSRGDVARVGQRQIDLADIVRACK